MTMAYTALSKASRGKNEATVYKNLYPDHDRQSSKPKFKIGDRLRITKKKTVFEKSYTPRWTKEVFTVSKIQYKIKDCNNDEIHGTFYEQELQKTNQEVYRIEIIIRKRGNMSLVKWVGYPKSFNSWVENKDFIKL